MAAASSRAVTPSYLFSIPTASGSLIGRNDRHLTLRLIGTRRYLTRFTDRPLRQATVVANVDFARRFASYFADSAPNAVLTYTRPGTQIPVSIVLTIAAPRWNATRSTWTFRATRIRKTSDTLPGSTRISPPRIPNPRTFTHATLLIDGGSTSVPDPVELTGGGIADSLGRSLQQLFATTIPGTTGTNLSMRVAVEYSSALTYPDGAVQSTASVPVELTEVTPFDQSIDLRVQMGSPLCNLELGIVSWQDANAPSSFDGAYTFDLALYSSRQPIFTETLRYAVATGPIGSAACSV